MSKTLFVSMVSSLTACAGAVQAEEAPPDSRTVAASKEAREEATVLNLRFDAPAPQRVVVTKMVLEDPAFEGVASENTPLRVELSGPEAYAINVTLSDTDEEATVRNHITIDRRGSIDLRFERGAATPGRYPWGVVWPSAVAAEYRSETMAAIKAVAEHAAKDPALATEEVRAFLVTHRARVEAEADPQLRAMLAASTAVLFGRAIYDEEDGLSLSRDEVSWIWREVPLDHEVWAAVPHDLLNALLLFSEETMGERAVTLRDETRFDGVAAAAVMAQVEWAKLRDDRERVAELLIDLDEVQPGGWFSKIAHGWYDPTRPLARGQSMPSFEFERFDKPGQRVSLESLRGRPSLLYIWSTWCSGCKKKMPELQRAFETCNDVTFVSLAEDDDPQKIRTFQERYGGLGWINVALGEAEHARLSEAWGMVSVPETLLLDAQGNIIVDDQDFRSVQDPVTLLREHGLCPK